MNTERFQLISPLNHAQYREHVRGLTKLIWPEFMRHDTVANENWHELLDRFAEYQVALLDTENNRVAAMGNSFPLRWDAALENLPDEGWDWAFVEAVKDHKQGLAPNYHCAIQIVIHPEYRNQRLSVPMITAVKNVTHAKGLQALIIPIRPSEKHNYPLTSMDDYVAWQNSDGLPFDAWLRVHVRIGGRIIKVCHSAKTMRGTCAEWEAWTGLKFPQSGRYIIPEALNPIEINLARNEGVYLEPNVWLAHLPGAL